MIARTKEEIEKFSMDTWKTTATDIWIKEDRVSFRPRAMGFVLKDMLKIAEFFGTQNVNIGAEVENGGYCETCSYETAEIEVTVKPDGV